MSSPKATFLDGIHIPPNKSLTEGQAILKCPAPDFVYLPLSMHIGAPAQPVVKLGDKVKMGQVIATAGGFVSSSIHASISGMVTGFQKRYLPNGMMSNCIVIKNDGLDTLSEDIKPREESEITPDLIRKQLQEKGIVGMGGATFPTHVKYAPPKDCPAIDTIILNGIECEPYVTSDHRVLLEYPLEIIQGLKYFMLASGAKKGVIAIEDNKPDAIALLTNLVEKEPNIEVLVCAEKYPQGSEKQLVYASTGRTIPDRGLPAAVGVVVDNVATAVATSRAIKENMPLIERVVTISGNAVNKPGNYLVRLGTLYSHVVEKAADGYKGDLARIISGGPMMGFAVNSLDFPIIKGSGAVLLFNHESGFAHVPVEETCVRCGHCVDVCPMFLEPTVIVQDVKKRNWDDAANASIHACIECGSCAFQCPAHIPLVQYIRMGKQFIGGKGDGGHNPFYVIKK
ncbi:MAG: electron transport complex subunit RsxC [Acidaminococcaceae bacterium]|nr:electron transport complex subunit RsxC [Acidaminococcaceae bacterium]MDD4722169.1 electron transport complex subunit RsxC [Acidaminococcaceae bacterium]